MTEAGGRGRTVAGRGVALLLGLLLAPALAAQADAVPASQADALPAAQAEVVLAPLPQGLWSAHLVGPGGDVDFGLELSEDGGQWSAWLVNGSERIPVPQVVVQPGGVRLELPHYDARLSSSRLQVDGQERLEGHWTRRTGLDEWSRMPFRAEAPAAGAPQDEAARGDAATADGARGDAATAAGAQDGAAGADAATAAGAAFAGRWAVDFSDDDQPAVGVFEALPGGVLHGTFLTTTGDLRYLAGRASADGLQLSCFDGSHAFLLTARLLPDGSLLGDFWSRENHHATWTAVRDERAHLPNGFQLTQWTGLVGLDQVLYADLTFAPRTLADPDFAGKARILQLFGSWCPNCHDACDLLVDLHRQYSGRGLSIVGLAFELTGDFDRDAEQVRRYAEQHEVPYPLLMAGSADKAQASKVFPLIDQVRAFPTTVFLHWDGRVRAVYQGFSGPATGADHDVLRANFEAIIEELLAEGDAAEAAALPPAPPGR